MYRAEPAFAHDRIPRVGVLLVNLGTPDAPTPAAVRTYLAQFLSDPRVVEIPSFAWQPFLHGVVLRTRPPRSAARYAAIWTKDGSPLAIHTNKQKVLLAGYLGQRLKALGLPADGAIVEQAMRYGNPPIGAAIERLREAACDRILVVPLYPQYAASTTGSVVDAVAAHLMRVRRVPALRSVATFPASSGYVSTMRKAGTRRTRIRCAATASTTEPVVLAAYCGYSGTTRMRSQPAARRRSIAAPIGGLP